MSKLRFADWWIEEKSSSVSIQRWGVNLLKVCHFLTSWVGGIKIFLAWVAWMGPLSLVSCIVNLNFELIDYPESSFSLV